MKVSDNNVLVQSHSDLDDTLDKFNSFGYTEFFIDDSSSFAQRTFKQEIIVRNLLPLKKVDGKEYVARALPLGAVGVVFAHAMISCEEDLLLNRN